MVERNRIIHGESLRKSNSLLLRKDELLSENNRETAVRLQQEWLYAKANHQLTLIDTCSDARVHVSSFLGRPDFINLSSIAASAKKSELQYIINHAGSKQIMLLAHHDGETVKEGKCACGCGGLTERGKMNSESVFEKNSVASFVKEKILSPDPVTQTFLKAAETASLTEKPVLAATVDHLTGLIYPFALFKDFGKSVNTSIPYSEALQNLREIKMWSKYEGNKIPVLQNEQMTQDFIDLLQFNRSQVVKIIKTTPDFAQSQKVQDPSTVAVSTLVMPLAVRYPHFFGKVNSSFKVFLPYVKEKSCVTNIAKDVMDDTLRQVEYPISHSNHADEGTSFYSTKNILIETPNMVLSEKIYEELINRSYIKEWLEKKQGQIFISEVMSGGKTVDIIRKN